MSIAKAIAEAPRLPLVYYTSASPAVRNRPIYRVRVTREVRRPQLDAVPQTPNLPHGRRRASYKPVFSGRGPRVPTRADGAQKP